MKSTTFNARTYIFDDTHKKAPYSYDGIRWMTRGDLIECEIKHFYGYNDKKSQSPFWMEADIPEINASIKSACAQVPKMPHTTANTFAAIVTEYFDNDKATKHIYGILDGAMITFYEMDINEFKTFIAIACAFRPVGAQVRFHTDNNKIRNYLAHNSI